MKTESVLPVHRPERQLAFNSKVDRAPSTNNRFPFIGRAKDTTVGNWLYQLWRICTTTLEGSLSETFKLVSSDDSDDARTSASGMSKITAKVGDDDSYLDAVVVDNDDHLDALAPGLGHQSDSSQRSGQGGSNSTQTGLGMHRDFHGDDGQHYQGGFKSWVIYRGWPEVVEFFEPRLPEHEAEFQRQTWHSTKLLAFSASLFLVLNWVLYLILNNDSTKHTLYAKIVFWGGFSLVTAPTPIMIALDMPRRLPITFQIWFCVAVWYCAFAEVIQIKLCHFFIPSQKKCFGKDFLAMYYYATALPALMMFVISKRLYNCVAQVIYFILLMALVIPDQGIFARNVVSFVVFSVFIQGLHYMMENYRRKMFLLALQLKAAFRAKHKAKLAESKASFTKRRFANYIFHEVRVPLNNAVLAFQLLQSGSAFKEDYARSTEIYALEQGLKMMKTVLNDVLDFEKMDSGHFETVAKPFPLHHSIRTILDQVEVQTGARQLVLDRRLDEQIDAVPLTLDPGRVQEPEGLWVIGSELRLHQVLTNLATNAVKYTPEGGGSIRISTEFLGISTRDELPGNPPDIEQENDPDRDRSMEKTTDTRVGVAEPHQGHGHSHRPHSPPLRRNGSGGSLQQTQCLNFRLTIHDSGPGIKPSDLVEDRLFQPFVQTTVGQSSGSGTGLGLAIVKQIIRLSGGRLGVISKRGEGSKFWIELSYPIASAAEVQAARESNTLTSLPYEHRHKHSGYISGPLVTASPQVADKFPDATLAYAVAAEAPAAQPEAPPPETPPRPSMPPQYESNPKATTVPRSESPSLPPATPPTPLNAVVSSTDPLLVLVVDDDAVTRVLSSKLLTKLGCIVHTAKDGKECVDMVLGAEPYTYDLICLDNFMPVMTGEDAVKEIRANDRNDFVVGCTGNALTEDQDSYREAGGRRSHGEACHDSRL
ncbi:Histidine kinase domain-containing protein [Mycena sanguinolenta]|uniref:histidine kinase n=1 Tax=Mycena sanguinolenta TaxID=230812 RepID=A0A8H7DGF7_9AGAR|nr:Histidine kinase domain-containing protein [Mycena sanguinolenta]